MILLFSLLAHLLTPLTHTLGITGGGGKLQHAPIAHSFFDAALSALVSFF